MKKAEDYQLIERKERPITTDYFDEKRNLIKRIRAEKPNGAAMRAFINMGLNHYGATTVQVYATESARLYFEARLKKNGQVEPTFRVDNPAEFDDPLRHNPTRAWAAFI